MTEAALARNGILDYFEQIYTCTETGAGKDEPLIYLKAAESMQAEPNETLVFEDALQQRKLQKKQDLWLLVSMMKKTGRIFPK